jgi:hypothetical protein
VRQVLVEQFIDVTASPARRLGAVDCITAAENDCTQTEAADYTADRIKRFNSCLPSIPIHAK